ncbi:MAG: photosystem II stability/assembly factor-like uncharacterized protein [Planctomycetota bacterium]|jgi:photosystem II stability/assembly factor-like uncharacterized protein
MLPAMRATLGLLAAIATAACASLEHPTFVDLQWRAIGPRLCGGRIEAIAVHGERIYAGAGSGNLWRSDDRGLTWAPIFDHESSFAIGAVAVAPSNPDVLWVGTGEVLMARSSYAGTGVFRSTDAGASWQNVGLTDSFHIGRIVVHPHDADVAWVAAIGHNYTNNKQRGVFRTRDGGKNWQHVLCVSPRVGAVEVVMHPNDPQTLFAVTWERERKAWNNIEYGPGSGVHVSTDGGSNWQRLAGGLPTGDIGRIGLAIARSQPQTMYAIVDNHERGDAGRRIGGTLYRSDDGGSTWNQTNTAPLATRIGYDLCEVVVSPDNPDEVWVPGHYLLHSTDGGKNFERVGGEVRNVLPNPAKMLHLDHHEFWIDPEDGDHLLLGTDGGLYRSENRGDTWLRLNNMPIAEVYALTIDQANPYNIYIGTQDNAALFGPATGSVASDAPETWQYVYQDRWGGGDSYFTYPDPSDPETVYYEHQFGELRRKSMGSGKTVSIAPRAEPGEQKLRRNWMTPYLVSKHDSNTLLYGAHRLYRSPDRGDTWQAISPDLTSNPGPSRRGNVPFGTITTISECRDTPDCIYVGTDDGLVQRTLDGGATWTDVTNTLPRKWVSRVVVSDDSSRVYVTMTGYREDDFRAHAFRSDDCGQTWRSISDGLPSESINVIREDPDNADLLYVGTDRGVHASLDGGRTWHSLRGNLPTTAVHDLAVARGGDLVIGTHGRGVFVLEAANAQLGAR